MSIQLFELVLFMSSIDVIWLRFPNSGIDQQKGEFQSTSSSKQNKISLFGFFDCGKVEETGTNNTATLATVYFITRSFGNKTL